MPSWAAWNGKNHPTHNVLYSKPLIPQSLFHINFGLGLIFKTLLHSAQVYTLDLLSTGSFCLLYPTKNASLIWAHLCVSKSTSMVASKFYFNLRVPDSIFLSFQSLLNRDHLILGLFMCPYPSKGRVHLKFDNKDINKTFFKMPP